LSWSKFKQINQNFENEFTTYSNNSVNFNFNNFSEDANFYKLSFGDGNDLFFDVDTISNYLHNYQNSGVFILETSAFFCNETISTKDTLCINVYPDVQIDIDAYGFQNSDSTILIQLTNNSSYVDSFFAQYNYQFSDGYSLVSNEVYHEIELPLIDEISFDVTTNICGQTYSQNYFVDVVLPTFEVSPNDIKFKVYPNPFSDFIHIEIDNNVIELGNQFQYILYNFEGKILKRQNLGKKTVHTNYFPSGVYFYAIRDLKGNILQNGSLIK